MSFSFISSSGWKKTEDGHEVEHDGNEKWKFYRCTWEEEGGETRWWIKNQVSDVF